MLKEFIDNTPEIIYSSIFLLTFVLVISSIPSVILASVRYNFFDTNDLHRKTHSANISRLGGVSIAASFTISILVFSAFINFEDAKYLIGSLIILSALGLRDDFYGANARTKFALQLAVAIVLVFFGDFRLSSLYGVLNIGDMNMLWGGIFSIILIIFLNNAFNLIDGVDGLAATIGALACLIFGLLFAIMHHVAYAFVAFGLAGAILGFLKYNWFPARIFMGDTGALVIGLTTAALALKFIELNKFTGDNFPAFYSAPAIAVSILIVPIFDSLRIFTIRIITGKSPFLGDRNHIHHRLQRLGYKPDTIVMFTLFINICVVISTVLLQHLGNFLLIILLISVCVVFNSFITCRLQYNRRLSAARSNSHTIHQHT